MRLCAGAVLAGIAGLITCLSGAPAHAQNAFCPTSFPGQSGIGFSINECTNGNTGAYSNTALASQSLSDLSQSSTQDATKATMASVSERRTAEADRCPAGFSRVDGTCRPIATASRFAPESTTVDSSMAMQSILLAYAPPMKALPAPVVQTGPRMGIWSQVYGDYERRTGRAPGIGEFSVLSLDVKSTTHSGGVIGGIDFTFRNLTSSGDGLIVGALGGYVSSHLSISSTNVSSAPAITPAGSGFLKARLSGPQAGAFASYFNGAFSTDLAFRVEFLDLDIAFNDILGFGPNPDLGIAAATVPFSGSGSTRLNNYTTSGNVNYRIPMSVSTWVEPTAGFQYTRSDYASDAANLGLADGSLLRLQAGARFGVESVWDRTRVTTVLTGLLYDNVVVNGGAIQNGGNPLILNDEGKLRAVGILALNFSHGNGVSSFIQGDIQGGEDLFGVGGKAGVRVAW
jgi:hypothetical protein